MHARPAAGLKPRQRAGPGSVRLLRGPDVYGIKSQVSVEAGVGGSAADLLAIPRAEVRGAPATSLEARRPAGACVEVRCARTLRGKSVRLVGCGLVPNTLQDDIVII